MRGDFAAWRTWRAWAAAGGSTANLFLQAAGSALQSDLMIRLIRVFDLDSNTSSFWYLHRCGLFGAGDRIDFKKLKDFSKQLKGPRNKAFVHIDQDAVFDPEKHYRDANINDSDIAYAIDEVWTVLCRLRSNYGESLGNFDRQGLQSLCRDFRRDFLEVVDR
jgi:hypothetical protein